MPRRANTKPKRAFSDAMRMSIGSVIVTPDADGGTVDGGDHRLLRLEDAQRQQPAAVARHALVAGRLAAAAGGERLAATGQVGAGAEPAARGR